MADALFYHLTRSPVEALLPVLIGKCLDAGWRVVLRAPDSARLDWLDQKLWLGDESAFLPHGQEGGAHDADQPVLLCQGASGANGAKAMICTDGAEIAPDMLSGLERVLILFDGGSDAAVQTARAQWRDLTAAGIKAQYWSEAEGRWQKKAES